MATISCKTSQDSTPVLVSTKKMAQCKLFCMFNSTQSKAVIYAGAHVFIELKAFVRLPKKTEAKSKTNREVKSQVVRGKAVGPVQ